MSTWFSFNRKTDNKRKNRGNSFTSGTQCDGNASGSITNRLLFPMQYNGCTYALDAFPDELLFIPYQNISTPRRNPSNLFSSAKELNHQHGATALLIHGNPKNKPTHFMILFHGNGVDLGMASVLWRPLIRSLPIHLLIVEYPGYGIMDGCCTCEEIIHVAEHTYNFVTRPQSNGGLGVSTDKLMILGRSIGTGPAAHIATKQCLMLILVSPFTSIHDLSSELMGKWTKYMLPKDFGTVMDDEHEDNDEDIYSQLQLQTKARSVSDPYQTSVLEEQKEYKSYELDVGRIQHAQTLPNVIHSRADRIKPNVYIESKTKYIRKKQAAFVFNNVAQIEQWQCKHLILFHGKNDTLIPYTHSNVIVETVKHKKPQIGVKQFLITGVGHNDVNIQFIGLRIFMQYQEELQSSVESVINIEAFVPYLDDPPQFNVNMNKVQNFNRKPLRSQSKLKKRKKKRKHGLSSSIPECFDSGSDEEEEQSIRVINEWDTKQCKFNKYQSDLPSKVYDLAFKLQVDAHIKEMQKVAHVCETLESNLL